MTINEAYAAICPNGEGIAPPLSRTMAILVCLVESVRTQCAQAAAGTETQGGYIHGDPGEGSWWEDDSDATRSEIVARIEALVLA